MMLNKEDWKERLHEVGFKYREKQYQFYKNCCDSLTNKHKINIVKGNMGVGKTFSFLEALNSSNFKKLIISTANNSLKDVWSKELMKFPEFSHVIIQAKKDTCYFKIRNLYVPDCNFDDCIHKHFDDSPCHYMQNWKSALESDIIICDNNYLIQIPLFIILNAYKNREAKTKDINYYSSKDCFVVFDEAHTLPSRIDGMYEKRLNLVSVYESYKRKLNNKITNLKATNNKKIDIKFVENSIKLIKDELNNIHINFLYIINLFNKLKNINFNKITTFKHYKSELYIKYTFNDFINGEDRNKIISFLEYIDKKAKEEENKKNRDPGYESVFIRLNEFFYEWRYLYEVEEQKIFQYMYYNKDKNIQEIYFFPQDKTKRLASNLENYKTGVFLSGTITNEKFFIHETVRKLDYNQYPNLSEFDVKEDVKLCLDELTFNNNCYQKDITVAYHKFIKNILDKAKINNENTIIVCGSTSKSEMMLDLLCDIYPTQIIPLYKSELFHENIDEFLNENAKIGILCLGSKGVEGYNYKNKKGKLNLKNIVVIDLPNIPFSLPLKDKKIYLEKNGYFNAYFLTCVLSNIEKVHQVVYRGKRDEKDKPNIYLCGSKYTQNFQNLPYDLKGINK